MNLIQSIRYKLISILSSECCANCAHRNLKKSRMNYIMVGDAIISGYLCTRDATSKWPEGFLHPELDRCDFWAREN